MSSKFSRFLSLLFVDKYNCIVCDRELKGETRHRICNSCFVTMEPIGNRGCLKCGRTLVSEGEYCIDCKNREMAFDRAVSPFNYGGAASLLITKLKFGGKRYIAEPMAKFMTDRLLEAELAADVVIPVPLHPNRKKQRGFNQSELLAEVIAEGLRLPLDVTSVIREKDTLASSGLSGGRTAREENVKDAFAVKEKEKIKGKTVLIVDDVLTTGTTANVLSQALKKAGAKSVYALTFATTREKEPIQQDF